MEQTVVKRLNKIKKPGYVTWGIPWKKGKVDRQSGFRATDGGGEDLPVQSAVRAYWPDGSVKWSLHTLNLDKAADAGINIAVTETHVSEENGQDFVKEDETAIKIHLGELQAEFIKDGSCVPRTFWKGKTYLTRGILTAEICHKTEENDISVNRTASYHGNAERYTIEEKGPLRVVVKIEGRHICQTKENDFTAEALPFTVRYYLHRNQPELRIVHTFCYDLQAKNNYIRSLGIRAYFPMKGEPYNRHVRIAGEYGLIKEALVMLRSWRPVLPEAIFERQIAGEIVRLEEWPEGERAKNAMRNMTAWDSYRIFQDSSEHYRVQKGTGHPECCSNVDGPEGKRACGFLYAGGESQGLGCGIKDFWQKYPSGLEATGLLTDEAEFTGWFYTPDSPPLDLRFYDIHGCSGAYYGAGQVERSIPYGIAVTNELTFFFYENGTPSDTQLQADAEKVSDPELLVCAPEYYHETGVFGRWSLPSRETPALAWLEERLARAVEFYQKEIEERKWYGLFNYGDIMHTYDDTRHCWRYDMGGYAWQNTELVPTFWLWYAFLRSGSKDIFKMAEAMCRHTAEVDVIHIGEYKGLGSRHNVKHWGCSAKEARISMAGHHRFYYYLTGDERTGDIMEEVRDADMATLRLDPLHNQYPEKKDAGYPTHARSGPDWSSYCANWMTHWERFEDQRYKEKICTGIKCLSKAPFRLISGTDFGYEPQTGILTYIGENSSGGSHLAMCMGGPQIYLELADLLDDAVWPEMLEEMGAFYYLSVPEKAAATNWEIAQKEWSFPSAAATLAAYAAERRKDTDLGGKLWEILLRERIRYPLIPDKIKNTSTRETLSEIPWLSTNLISQWCLNIITALDMAKDYLPETVPEYPLDQSLTPLQVAELACDTMMRTYKAEDLPPKGHFHYHQGVFLSGMQKTYELCGKEKYFQYVKDWVDSIIDEQGEIHWFDPGELDDIQPGILLFLLYDKTGDERYQKALDTLLPYILHFPRNQEGGLWHKEKNANQMWLDGLYMAGPICAQYGREFGHPEYFDLVTFQAKLMEQKTKDTRTGLWYHAWDSLKQRPWADPDTGLSPEFWGRAEGWVPVALLDELDYLPENHPDYQKLADMSVRLLDALCRYQDKSGLWYQVVDKGGQKGNWLESSCTCLFTAGLCKAVRKGFMDKSYLSYAKRGYQGVVSRLKQNEKGVLIDNICVGTGVGDYRHYCNRPTSVNDLHGAGAFLLMCTEAAQVYEMFPQD